MHWTPWLTQSLRQQWASPWMELALAIAAILAGAIIGLERERHDKPAGLRTLILVCLGSAVFTMISFVFTSTSGDSGRVAAQIVTGVGFLGAGAILHARGGVSGMTTAATVWMTAAIGLTVGAGFAAAGIGLSVLVRGVLTGVRAWEIRHLGGIQSMQIELVFDPDHGKSRVRFEHLRDQFHIRGEIRELIQHEDGSRTARVDLRLPRRHLNDFLEALVAMPSVREIRETHVKGPEASPPTSGG